MIQKKKKKASDYPKINKMIRGMIKSVTQHSYILRRNPTSKWVDFKTTHQ
jgi:hypothetical protein